MKTLNNYITEKFKINSKNIHQNIENINFSGLKEGINFPTKDDIEAIKDLVYELPELPEKVFTTTSSVAISFKRDSDKFIRSSWHIYNYIKILCDIRDNKKIYHISFTIIHEKDTKHVPYICHNINDCFNKINQYWKEIDFSKAINEYK